MTDETTLLPCPFCGGSPYFTTNFYEDVFRVNCPECGATQRGKESKQKASEAWNQRYEPTCKLENTGTYNGEVQLGHFTCSKCGNEYMGEPYPFCPICGRKVVDE